MIASDRMRSASRNSAEVELVGRQRLEVERPLLVGRAVHRAAVDEDQVRVLAGPDVLGALEHHVLEQMGEAGAALALVARADVVVDDDGEDRRRVVFGDDHAQAVLELGVGELDLGRSGDGTEAERRDKSRPRAV